MARARRGGPGRNLGGRRRMSRRRAHPFAARWAVATTLIFCLTVLWGISTPNPSGPDEPAHLIKASSLDGGGTLIGSSVPPGRSISKGSTFVMVPRTYLNIRTHGPCDYDNIEIGTGCGPPVVGSSKLVRILSYEARYPPLYYAIVGIPSILTTAPSVTYYMRALSGLIVAVLLGLAFASLVTWSRSRLVLVGAAITATPTVFYLGGVVNPSAMEVAGGFALWSTLSMLVLYESEDPPMALVVGAVISAIALSASRPISTAIFAFIVATLVALRPANARRLLGFRRVRVALAVTVAFAIASGIYVLLAKSYEVEAFPIADRSEVYYALAVFGRVDKYLRQVVGAFGAPNFAVPTPLLMIWWIATTGLLLAGLLVGRKRDAVVTFVATALLGFIIPFVIVFSHVKSDGVIWQGRYSLPLIVGLPLLASISIAERHPDASHELSRRLGLIVVPVLVIGWVGSFYWLLRRYTVGLAFPYTNAFSYQPGDWVPVISPLAIFLLFVLVTLAFAGWVVFYCMRPPPLALPAGPPVGPAGRSGRGLHHRGRPVPDARPTSLDRPAAPPVDARPGLDRGGTVGTGAVGAGAVVGDDGAG